MDFSIFAIITLLIASIDIILGIVLLLQDPRDQTNRAYGFFALTVALWGFGVGFYLSVHDFYFADLLARFLYLAGGSISASFLYFVFIFTHKAKMNSRLALLIFAPTLLLIPFYFFTDLLVMSDGSPAVIGRGFIYGPYHLLFDIHLWTYFLLSFIVLVKKYKNSTAEDKRQLLFITISTYSVLFVSAITNLGAPLFSVFSLIWIGPTATVLWVVIVAYAVVRHQLFDMRVIASEFLVVSLWLLMLVQVFFSKGSYDTLINFVFLLFTLILGVYLIRAILRDVESREKLEILTTKLKSANSRLKELDRQKSEFLSIATHQLRGPLAGIRGHLSLLLDGSYGKIPGKAKEVTSRIFSSSGLLVQTVNDFLDVSRIEQGRMQYDMTRFECSTLAQEVFEELKPIAKDRKLDLTYKSECDEKSTVKADYGKLRHVIFNLVDNALKYTEKGWVNILMKCDAKKKVVRIEISDSGIGISKKEIGGLFEKFVRARDASGININGTGLGLYVAREMVEAHDGKVWAESKGKGKGSTFIIEIPAILSSKRKA